MSSGERWRLGQRPGLDGLRGVAIGLVLVGHLLVPGLFAAGIAGVTLFFVLSGFLITSLLGEEHDRTGRISLRRFYARRARRLAPALAMSTAVFATVGLVAELPGFFQWSDLWPVIGYYGNWTIASGGALGALGGTWSLAVEEQFYIVWPLVAIVAMRRGWPRLGTLAAVVVAGSLAARLFESDTHLAYYRTEICAVSLAAGAFLAVVAHRGRLTMPSWAPPLGGVFLAAACLMPRVVAWEVTPLLATVGAVLVLPAALRRDTPLGHSVLRWLGTRSYSIYLWHIPPMWVLNYYSRFSWVEIAVLTVPVSLLVAEASYRWVERPFRQAAAARAAMSVPVKVLPSKIAAP